MKTCPQCHLQVPEISPISNSLREKVRRVDPNYPLPEQACTPCQNSLLRQATSADGVLVAQERAREVKKKRMWQNRVPLVKHGHTMMKRKRFSEAAVSYEKYIRLIEIVYDCKPNALTPELLKDSARTAELTVITGVYWDLVRIYDSSDKYAKRQKIAATELAKFASYTPVFIDLLRKAEAFQKQSRHPEVIKAMITECSKKRTRCFIATSAFEAPMADEVTYLRNFRDEKLKTNPYGRKFVYFYYKYSRPVACFLDKQRWLKPTVRACLRAVIKCVRHF